MYLADVAAPRFRNQDRIPFRLNLGVLHLVSAVVPAPAVLSERVGPVLARRRARARARGAAGFECGTRRGKHTERVRDRERLAPLSFTPPVRYRDASVPHYYLTHTGPRTRTSALPHTLSLVDPLRVPTDTDTTDTWFVTPVPKSGFPCALGSTDSCTTTVHMKPFSASVLQDPSGVFATTTKICTDGGSRQAHAHNPSTLTVATPLLLGTSAAGRTPKSPPPNLCRPRARYRHRAIAPPILRASCFGR